MLTTRFGKREEWVVTYNKRVPDKCLGDIYYGVSSLNISTANDYVLRDVCVIYECVDSFNIVQDKVLSIEIRNHPTDTLGIAHCSGQSI